MPSASETQAAVGTAAPQSPAVQRTNNTLSGGSIVLCLVAAVLFLRFFRKTRDRLFLYFAAAFAILALNRILFQFVAENSEGRTYLYIIRLLAFLLIIYAIIEKNLQHLSHPTPPTQPRTPNTSNTPPN